MAYYTPCLPGRSPSSASWRTPRTRRLGLLETLRFQRPANAGLLPPRGTAVPRPPPPGSTPVATIQGIEKDPRNEGLFLFVTAGKGVEPRLTASKAAVLPLDDPAIFIFSQLCLPSILRFYDSDWCSFEPTPCKIQNNVRSYSFLLF